MPTPQGEEHCGKTIFPITVVEVFLDIEGVKSGIESAKTRLEAQASFHLVHQRKEIADIGPVERLGELSQDELTPV